MRRALRWCALIAVLAASPVLAQTTLAQAPSEPQTASPLPVPVDQPVPHSVPDHDREGDIIVSSHGRHSPADPLAGANVVSFTAVQAVDRAVMEPVALAYEHVVPEPVRDGVHNAFYNLREPVIAANFLLQHKVGKAGETVARLAINSTLGLGGLFDVARRKPFRLPHRANGLADTLGFYGVGPGPYMVVPLLGATTVRDLLGTVADRAALPLMLGGSLNRLAIRVPMIVLSTLDRRLVDEPRVVRLRESPLDPYVAMREDYLRRRRIEIAALRDGTERPENPRDDVVAPTR